jgi:hypothetical protein
LFQDFLNLKMERDFIKILNSLTKEIQGIDLEIDDINQIIDELSIPIYVNHKKDIIKDDLLMDNFGFYNALKNYIQQNPNKQKKIQEILIILYNKYKPLGLQDAVHQFIVKTKELCNKCLEIDKNNIDINTLCNKITIACADEFGVVESVKPFILQYKEPIKKNDEMFLLNYDMIKQDKDFAPLFEKLKEYWLGHPADKEDELKFVLQSGATTKEQRYLALMQFRKPYISKKYKQEIMELCNDLLDYCEMYDKLSV